VVIVVNKLDTYFKTKLFLPNFEPLVELTFDKNKFKFKASKCRPVGCKEIINVLWGIMKDRLRPFCTTIFKNAVKEDVKWYFYEVVLTNMMETIQGNGCFIKCRNRKWI